MADVFTCAQCAGVFEKSWSEDQAQAERAANGWADVDCAVVCDDCYKEIMAWIAKLNSTADTTSESYWPKNPITGDGGFDGTDNS